MYSPVIPTLPLWVLPDMNIFVTNAHTHTHSYEISQPLVILKMSRTFSPLENQQIID